MDRITPTIAYRLISILRESRKEYVAWQPTINRLFSELSKAIQIKKGQLKYGIGLTGRAGDNSPAHFGVLY